MGLYTLTRVYRGRLLSTEAQARLADAAKHSADIAKALHEGWVTPLDDKNGYSILAPPGCVAKLGSMDGIIEPHEQMAGAVAWSELTRIARELVSPLVAASRGDLELLELCVKAAAPPNAKREERSGVYVLQADWSSYDLPQSANVHVTHNLPVTGFPTQDSQ